METKELGRIIKQFRKNKNYTQKYIAQMNNTGTRFLSDLENGKETAEIGLVLNLLNTIGLDIIIVPRIYRNTPEYRTLKGVLDENP